MQWSIWIGFDPKEAVCYDVAVYSLRKHLTAPIPIRPVSLYSLREQELYRRPTSRTKDGRLYDDISEHSMSTEFAISRFLVPALAQRGLALFTDCDVLFRGSVLPIFLLAERFPDVALWCVQHQYTPSLTEKMDGQQQSIYARKNWSSVMLFNLEHPSMSKLTVDLVNSVPGRDLHRFCWLDDDELGSLPQDYNYLVGEHELRNDPQIVHFTNGPPYMYGYENAPFASEWWCCVEPAIRR